MLTNNQEIKGTNDTINFDYLLNLIDFDKAADGNCIIAVETVSVATDTLLSYAYLVPTYLIHDDGEFTTEELLSFAFMRLGTKLTPGGQARFKVFNSYRVQVQESNKLLNNISYALLAMAMLKVRLGNAYDNIKNSIVFLMYALKTSNTELKVNSILVARRNGPTQVNNTVDMEQCTRTGSYVQDCQKYGTPEMWKNFKEKFDNIDEAIQEINYKSDNKVGPEARAHRLYKDIVLDDKEE